MQQQRDEHIVCADCGASFLFSASEASVFAERGLVSPKRCKDCRRARKERGAGDGGSARGYATGAQGNGHGRGPAPFGHDGGLGRGPRSNGRGPQRYTGDVNEYRSPMQDSYAPMPWRGAPDGRGARRPAVDGNVQPAARPGLGGGFAQRPPRHVEPSNGSGGPYPARDGAAPQSRARRPAEGGQAGGAPRRAPAEKFSITCNACGAQAEVPFQPAEGREVFCQTCYRARKPV